MSAIRLVWPQNVVLASVSSATCQPVAFRNGCLCFLTDEREKTVTIYTLLHLSWNVVLKYMRTTALYTDCISYFMVYKITRQSPFGNIKISVVIFVSTMFA